MTEDGRPVPSQAPDLLEEADELIARLQAHPDAAVREQVSRLLAAIDAVHRAGLTHLVAAIRAMAGDAFVNRLVSDPAIRLLLMSYDLVAVDRRLQAEEAIDVVRGHLHAHGVDVELTDVVGGVVYARLHPNGRRDPPPREAVRRDLEAALQENLLGFQELVFQDRSPAPAAVIPVGSLRVPQKPVYRAACAAADIAPGTTRAVEMEGTPVLIVNVDGQFHAVRNRCGDSPLPLAYSELQEWELVCSWHGCRWDVRTGKRIDRDGDRLPVYPVTVADGEVRVAVGAEPCAS
jgi:nitrite reductase/ring-hydroxylating ferredoxin subunit